MRGSRESVQLLMKYHGIPVKKNHGVRWNTFLGRQWSEPTTPLARRTNVGPGGEAHQPFVGNVGLKCQLSFL